MQTVIILSISSDIGRFLAEQYLQQGFRVIGTYRTRDNAGPLLKDKRVELVKCDVSSGKDVQFFAKKLKEQGVIWDIFISCVGHPLPVMPFFESDFKEWSNSVYVNCLGQLHALHALYPLRQPEMANVVFFAGGGMNGTVVNFSAYTASKIFLAKMCEFLSAENKDLNIFIVGPGWTKTKIHQTILSDRRTAKQKAVETKNFLKEEQGTSLQDIFDCIDWLIQEGPGLSSGRNFSVVYDPWRPPTRAELIKALQNNQDMYKIRRSGNQFLQRAHA